MNAIGLILAGGISYKLKELTTRRAAAAMPVAGSFRSVDFALSNMTNSHINTVAVLTQYNARSLNEHLSSSKWWNFGRKQGGLFVFNPTITQSNNAWFRGTADCMYQNIDFLKKRHEPYVVIANANCVYKMDYNKMIDYHIQKGADITIACKEMEDSADLNRFGVIRMNETSRIFEFEEKPMMAHSNMVSTGVYVLRRRLLIEMLEECESEGRYDFVNDIIIRYKNLKKIYGYETTGYWSNISTVESYYRTNLDFLKNEVREYFNGSPSIYSKVDDLPPAKYNSGCSVSNSLISSGCIINGTVENSVLFKKVFVGVNSVIKNSVILNDVYIGDNSRIEDCIVESRGTMVENSYHVGNGQIEVVVETNERYVL
jgi:glucose-1-phosphate adenylyltransferase